MAEPTQSPIPFPGGSGSSFPVTSAVAVNSGGSVTVNTGGSILTAGSGTIAATSVPFSGVAAGTNANALVVGTGGSISTSGTGTIGAGGSNTQVQFNNSGVLAGTSAITIVAGVPTLAGNFQTGNSNKIGDVAGGGAAITLGGNDVLFTTFGGQYVNVGNGGSVALKLSEVGGGTLAGATGFTIFAPDSITHTLSYNANNNGISSLSGAWVNTNVTPVTVSANVATDQLLMAATLPAGTLNRVGRSIRIWLAGVYSTPAASSATINIKAKLCTVSGCGSGTVISLASITSSANPGTVTNNAFNLSLVSTTQTAGASAAFEAHGVMGIDLGALTTAADSFFSDTNTATVGTIDSTAQLFLQITGAFSAASASNSLTQRQMISETIG
jgi:fibronectin-binding autotransporter adhesin